MVGHSHSCVARCMPAVARAGVLASVLRLPTAGAGRSVFYPVRFRDAMTGKWVRTRYVVARVQPLCHCDAARPFTEEERAHACCIARVHGIANAACRAINSLRLEKHCVVWGAVITDQSDCGPRCQRANFRAYISQTTRRWARFRAPATNRSTACHLAGRFRLKPGGAPG
jgi:hypothetical protein